MRTEYFKMWKEASGNTMAAAAHVLAQDLAAGYSPSSDMVRRQAEAIQSMAAETAATVAALQAMDPRAAEKWCKADLTRRGII